jgi:hypothetical protein
MLLTPVNIIPSVGTKIYQGRPINLFNINFLLEIHYYFQNQKTSLIKWQIATINIDNPRQHAQRWTVEMQNWTALYCPEFSEAARCRNVLFVLNIGDSGERQCDCWWRYKCITVVNNLYVHQMILQSSTPPVTVCIHMMTANSTWCLRTISCIFYLRTWQSKWRICSTETKCWVSWKVVYIKYDLINVWILIMYLSVCLFQGMYLTNIYTKTWTQCWAKLDKNCSTPSVW